MDNYGKRGNCHKAMGGMPKVPCGPGYHCCVEKDSNFGTCCKEGTCMKSGHCQPEGSSISPPEQYLYEGFSGDGNGNCNNWKWAFYVLTFITLVLAYGFIVLGMRLRNGKNHGY